jgi:hypothetical protein
MRGAFWLMVLLALVGIAMVSIGISGRARRVLEVIKQ